MAPHNNNSASEPFDDFIDQDLIRKIYTVSELTEKIKALLEESFPFIWIVGEISNFRTPLSGHFYFTLKDANAQINAVMFRGQQRQLKFEPEDGMRVTGMGRLGLYEPRGTYQIILEYMEPSGIGALQIAYEKLKARLADEGLFDEQQKQLLPFLPQKIVLITSPTGAVVHDMLNIIDRRFPNVTIQIWPVKVQGDGAEDEIVAALDLLRQHPNVDAAILARGGGSLEDLQAFNSESVARAIFACDVPIIAAIGHETDYTIADFVADLRAPTPSAAAELVFPIKSELLQMVNDFSLDLQYRMDTIIQRLRHAVVEMSKRLTDPRKKTQDWRLRLDDFAARLNRCTRLQLDRSAERLEWWHDRLLKNSPANQVQNAKAIIHQNIDKLIELYKKNIQLKSARLGELSARLEALSPIAILERGYSITRTLPDAKIVLDPETVALNQDLEVIVSKGALICQVKEKLKNGPKNI
ncbi:MAG: exodeoxyribonuclease VII large subunit [Desulfobacterales bacterium]|jgi:exodeoxyribonuclease VII large subunit|nr:exodeoxyribonuclease VII large subunit [Deltaproteobacteria bacterium]